MWMEDTGCCSNNLFETKVLMNFQSWKFKLNGMLTLEALISMKIHLDIYLKLNGLPILEQHFHWTSHYWKYIFNGFPIMEIETFNQFSVQEILKILKRIPDHNR